MKSNSNGENWYVWPVRAHKINEKLFQCSTWVRVSGELCYRTYDNFRLPLEGPSRPILQDKMEDVTFGYKDMAQLLVVADGSTWEVLTTMSLIMRALPDLTKEFWCDYMHCILHTNYILQMYTLSGFWMWLMKNTLNVCNCREFTPHVCTEKQNNVHIGVVYP